MSHARACIITVTRIKVNLKEAAESADDSDDLKDFIADFGEQCGTGGGGSGSSGRGGRSDETFITAVIPTPVRTWKCDCGT